MTKLAELCSRPIRRSKVVVAAFLALTLVSAFTVIAPANEASAASCRYYRTSTPASRPAGGGYYAGDIKYVPYDSACSFIAINKPTIGKIVADKHTDQPTCALFRVRFYPTSGGSQLTEPRHICTWSDARNDGKLATNVLNGTKYRIESNQAIHFQAYD